MADNFNLRSFLSENKLTKNAQLLKEARVEGFDENQKAFKVTFVNKYGGGDSRILNAETPEQAEEVFNDIFVNNPDFVQSIKSVEPYQVPAAKPQAEPQPGLEGVNYNSIELDGIDSDDYPDFVDAYVISAEFEDGTPLSEEELEQLTDELHQSGELSDMAAQSLYENKKKPVMENLTAKERRLVEMVQDALGIDNEEEDFINPGNTPEDDINRKNYLKTFGTPPTTVSEDEMVQDKPLPKYESIEELMKEIEHGTNEAAHNYKMEEMKRVYEALEAKVGSLEEGEHAEHIDQKAVKQMRKDIAALRKAEEKLRKEFDKKFSGKEKKATPAKEKATEALQENIMENFNLKKFLVENKLTTNSRMLSENYKVHDLVFIKSNGQFETKPREIHSIAGNQYAVSGHIKRDDGKGYSTEGGKYVDKEDVKLASLDEVAGEDLELKSAAKQIFSVLKKYGLKPQYEADGKQFMSKDYSQSGYGAYIHVHNGIMTVSVYDRGIWQTIQRKQKVNELDMGTVSYPTEEEKKEIGQIAGKIYNDIISVLGKDKFEFKNNQQPDKYGNYMIYVRKAAAAQ